MEKLEKQYLTETGIDEIVIDNSKFKPKAPLSGKQEDHQKIGSTFREIPTRKEKMEYLGKNLRKLQEAQNLINSAASSSHKDNIERAVQLAQKLFEADLDFMAEQEKISVSDLLKEIDDLA